jgi:hypothetical protein
MIQIFLIPLIADLSQLTANTLVVHSSGLKTRTTAYLHAYALLMWFIAGRISIIIWQNRWRDNEHCRIEYAVSSKLLERRKWFCGHSHVFDPTASVMNRYENLGLYLVAPFTLAWLFTSLQHLHSAFFVMEKCRDCYRDRSIHTHELLPRPECPYSWTVTETGVSILMNCYRDRRVHTHELLPGTESPYSLAVT